MGGLIAMSNICNARNSVGLSQKQVALSIGVSYATVSEWESGKKFPAGKNLIKLAELFSCSTDYLLGKSDIPSLSYSETKKEPTPRERLASEFVELLGEVPEDKLEKFKNLFRATVEAIK